MSLLCETLNASRSAYYAWRQDELGPRRREDNRLMPLMRSVFWEHRRRYGARRIAVELAARNEPCGRRRVGRLMAPMGLVAIQPRSFKPRTTDSRHTLGYRPGNYGLAGRDSSMPPPAGLDSSHRSWRPVRRRGLPQNADSRADAPKHEPCRGPRSRWNKY